MDMNIYKYINILYIFNIMFNIIFNIYAYIYTYIYIYIYLYNKYYRYIKNKKTWVNARQWHNTVKESIIDKEKS